MENRSTKDYLEEELKKICLFEATTQPELKITSDQAMEIYKQIQLELVPTSLSEFSDDQIAEIFAIEERNEKINQKDIIDQMNNDITVICPLCQKSNLIQEDSNIICTNAPMCNLRIDDSKLNLIGLSKRLGFALNQHDCSEVPIFQFNNMCTKSVKESHLIMTCNKCNLMEFII